MCLNYICKRKCSDEYIIEKKIVNYIKTQDNNEDHINEICSICLLNINEKFITLDCEHSFHNECFVEWYKKSNNKDCPICRTEIIIV